MADDSVTAYEVFDCLRCGACCATPDARAGYVDLTAVDVRRLPAAYTRFVQRSARGMHLAARAFRGGSRCVALRGRLGGSVRCSIYDARPRGCRRLQPGSRACRMLREINLERDGGDDPLAP